MQERSFLGWYTASRNGADIPQWRAALASCGVDVSTENGPVFQDAVPRKPRNGEVTFDSLPDLAHAIQMMRPIRAQGLLPVLVVPNFAHFVSNKIWCAAWERIADLGGVVICAETRTEVSDVESGLHLLRQRRGRTVAEKAKKARLKIGRPTRQLNPGKREEAIRMFGNRDFTIEAIATFAGVSVMTMRRRLKEWTGTREKAEAVLLADEGKWPPKRKLR